MDVSRSHLSQWRSRRATDWVIPRFEPGARAILFEQSPLRDPCSHAPNLARARTVRFCAAPSHPPTPSSDGSPPVSLGSSNRSPDGPETELSFGEVAEDEEEGRDQAAGARHRVLLRPPHPPYPPPPSCQCRRQRGAHLRLHDPAYRGSGGIPARIARPRARQEHPLPLHALLPPSLQPHSSLYLSSLLPPFLPPPAHVHAALPNARPRSHSSQCFSAGSSGHLGWGRRADEPPHQHA